MPTFTPTTISNDIPADNEDSQSQSHGRISVSKIVGSVIGALVIIAIIGELIILDIVL